MNWIILRCSAKNTIALVDSLSKEGYEGQVWTPTIEVEVRQGPSRDRVKKSEALLPSFSFAHSSRKRDLMDEQMNPASNHPSFYLFQYMGCVPSISDRQLDPLRVAEAKIENPKGAPPLPLGTSVRTSEGGFQGLIGKVVRSQGKWTWVEFPGFLVPVKINTFLLLVNEG